MIKWFKRLFQVKKYESEFELKELEQAYYEIYTDIRGVERWRLISSKGENIASSTGNNKDLAPEDQISFISHRLEKIPNNMLELFEIYKNKKNKFSWRLISYDSDCDKSIVAIAGNHFDTKLDAFLNAKLFQKIGTVDKVINNSDKAKD